MSMMSRLREQISAFTSLPQRLARDDGDGAALEDLRAAMLRLLADHKDEAAFRLELRIRCAATVQSLWFLRSDLMAFLSPSCGETEALHRVEDACEPYRFALPRALRVRRTGPHHHYDSLP